MRIAIETIEKLQESVKSLPAVEVKKREVSKPEAVKLLATQVAELQEKGYTIEMIAEIFSNHGLEIKPQTLKSYLTRAKGQKTAKKRAPKPPAKSSAKPDSGAGKKASLEANEKRISDESVTNRTDNIDDAKGAGMQQQESPVKTTTNEPVKSGTFKPRDDSREI